MLDVIFVAVILIFFVLGVGYVGLCDRLRPSAASSAKARAANEK